MARGGLKQLQAKDQAIQSQEAQLAQTRQQLNDDSNKLAEMKTKLDDSQKELAAAQQRLGVAVREANRVTANRSTAVTRTASRPPDTAYNTPPLPAPTAARRTAEPGVYETIQATSVYDNPSSAGRVITQIGKGTKINVVSSVGDWLEVRSKHGNPPGYVRSDDARIMVAERAENPEGARPASRSSRRSSASPRNDRFDAPIHGS